MLISRDHKIYFKGFEGNLEIEWPVRPSEQLKLENLTIPSVGREVEQLELEQDQWELEG